MNFDTLTLSAVRDEIRARALGGRVQRVVAPAPDQIALDIYAQRATHHLLIHAGHQNARVHFVSQRLPAGAEPPSPLLLLLRKWLRNGRLVEVRQPPLERVLSMTVQSLPRGSVEPVRHELVVEIIGRRSNVLLLDASRRIRDSLRRFAGDDRRRRIEPRALYQPPPALPQSGPEAARPDDLIAQAAQDVPAWRALLRAVAAVSPTLAREALTRARVDPDTSSAAVRDWGDVLAALRQIFAAAEQGGWRPCLVPAQGGWQAFAPYSLTFLERPCQTVESISEVLETYFAAGPSPRPVSSTAVRLSSSIDAAIQRAERRIGSLQAALQTADAASELRWSGETLLAKAHEIPPGAREFRHAGRTIALDPSKMPAANAQDYFRRYRDRQAAAREVPKLLRRAELDLAFLRQAADDLNRAESPAVVRAIEHLLREAGQLRRTTRKRRRDAQPSPASWSLRGHRILAGRTAAENQRVTFRAAGAEDLWLHARGLPGAHVILCEPGEHPDDALLELVASLAAYFSAGRHDAQVEVDVTRRKFVRHIRGAGPGQVTYRHERTVRVAPQAPAALGIQPAKRHQPEERPVRDARSS